MHINAYKYAAKTRCGAFLCCISSTPLSSQTLCSSMSSNKGRVTRMIQDLGLDPNKSNTASFRNDVLSYMRARHESEGNMLAALQDESLIHRSVTDFLESHQGRQWFDKETGRRIKVKSTASLHFTLSRLLKYWIKSRRSASQHAIKAGDKRQTVSTGLSTENALNQ